MAVVLFEEYDPFINIKRDEVRTITETHDLQATNDTTQNAAAWNDTDPVEVGNSNSQGRNTGTVTTTDHFHVEGDSAITDAQDVLKKELEVRKQFNLYDIIANEYKTEFCLLVY